MGVSVIVPAFNEEKSIDVVIKEINATLKEARICFELIVVDDGSTDNTTGIARKGGAYVLRHPTNLGYGAALKTGISVARYEQIVIIDADGTYPGKDIPKLVDGLSSADMVVGSRSPSSSSIPLGRRLAKWILRRLSMYITGSMIPDFNSGMRAFSIKLVKPYLNILPQGFSFTTTLTVSLLCDGYRVKYIDIPYFKRIGKSKITPWHFIDFTTLILRLSILFNPSKVFLPLGFTLEFIGVIKLILDIMIAFTASKGPFWSTLLCRPVISNSALILLLFGLQIILIGMVADAVVRRMGPFGRNKYISGSMEVYKPDNVNENDIDNR